jgi:hypothetical protein
MKIDALQANRHEAEMAFRSSYLYTSSRLYNEFFADLVAVLYFEDLHAMTRSLDFTDLTTGRLRPMDPQGIRSFQANGRHHRWQPPADISKRTIYRAFAPVRAHMGRHYLDAYNLRHHKSDILTAALRASVKEFEFLEKQVDVLQLSPEELAERFIQALDQELTPWRVF